MTWFNFLRVWRVIVLAIGAFDIGFVFMVAGAYMRGHVKPGPYGSLGHVLAITASYVLLAGTVWITIFIHAIDGDPQTFRLYTASLAYPLGIFALVKLVRYAERGRG